MMTLDFQFWTRWGKMHSILFSQIITIKNLGQYIRNKYQKTSKMEEREVRLADTLRHEKGHRGEFLFYLLCVPV